MAYVPHFVRRGDGPPLLLLHGNGEDGSYFARQLDHFSADLLDFMDGQGIEKADVLGFSDGGNIALTFALAHQERIRRLVLNGANLSPAGVKAHVQIPIVLGWRIASLFARRSPQARQNAEILGLMVKEPHINPAALSALRVPTLVDMIRDRHTQSIAASLPNARLERIPGDHFIAAKNPEAFNRAVEAFLAD